VGYPLYSSQTTHSWVLVKPKCHYERLLLVSGNLDIPSYKYNTEYSILESRTKQSDGGIKWQLSITPLFIRRIYHFSLLHSSAYSSCVDW